METAKHHILPLTGLRVIPAMIVLAYHAKTLPQIQLILPTYILGHAHLMVDVFFILSGFVLGYMYESRFLEKFSWHTCSQYYWARFARIYPVYLFTWLLTAAVILSAHHFFGYVLKSESQSLGGFIQGLFMVQHWFGLGLYWNVPAWSISAEVFAYILLPVVIYLTRHASVKTHIGILIALVALQVSVYLGHLPVGLVIKRAFLEFWMGYQCYQISKHLRAGGMLWALIWALCVIGFFGGIVALQILDLSDFWIIPVIGLLVLASTKDEILAPRLIGNKLFVYLGKLSLSFYLIHELIVNTVTHLWRMQYISVPDWAGWPVLAFEIIATFLAASLMFHFIEEPARRQIRQWRGFTE